MSRACWLTHKLLRTYFVRRKAPSGPPHLAHSPLGRTYWSYLSGGGASSAMFFGTLLQHFFGQELRCLARSGLSSRPVFPVPALLTRESGGKKSEGGAGAVVEKERGGALPHLRLGFPLERHVLTFIPD